MVEADQARTWEADWPALGPVEWLRQWLGRLGSLFDSWKNEGGEDDSMSTADPELVAALQFLAALLDDAEER